MRPGRITVKKSGMKEFFQNIIGAIRSPSQSEILKRAMEIESGIESEQRNPDKLLIDKNKDLLFYDKMLLDDRISSVLDIKKRIILSFGGEFVAGDDSPESKERRDWTAKTFEDMHETGEAEMKVRFWDVFDNLLDAMAYGFRCAELVWRLVESKWVIRNIKFMHPIFFDFDYDEYANLDKVLIGKDYGRDTVVEAKDIQHKLLIFVYPYLRDGNWYGKSDLTEIYTQYYSKYHIFRWRNIYLQNFGQSLPIVKFDKKATKKAELEDLKDGLKNLQENMYMLNPAVRDAKTGELHGKFEFDFRDAGTAKGTEQFEQALEQLDKQIARKLLLPDKLGFSESPGGAYNLGENQFNFFMDFVTDTHGRLEDSINNPIRLMEQVNFGEQESYTEFRFNSADDRITSKVLKELIDAGVVNPKERWIRSRVSVPELTEEEEKDLAEGAAAGGVDAEGIVAGVVGKPGVGQPGDTGAASEGTPVANPSDTLNGAQIKALVEVIQAVAKGELDIVAAFEVIQSGFPIAPERINKMLAAASRGTLKPVEKPKPGFADQEKMKNLPRGYPVDFRKLAQTLDQATAEFERDYTGIHAEQSQYVVDQVQRKKIIENDDGKAMNALRMKKAGLKKALSLFYAKMYMLGKVSALDEIRPRIEEAEKLKDFVEFQDDDEWLDREWLRKFLDEYGDLGKLSKADLKYLRKLRDKAFFITGVEEERILKIAKSAILEGTKEGLPAKNVIAKIESVLREDRKRYATTIARTNMSDAFNTGRMNTYQADNVRPFIEAYQYQAIMDTDTTKFCSSHDDQWIASDDPRVPLINTPNHFNCRSILVAIMVGEDEVKGAPFYQYKTRFKPWGTGVPAAEQKPAKGFGG